jgi:hypothetical protein
MNQPKHFSRANQDRERSRQLMEKYSKAKQLKGTPYPSGFSEFRMRFIAPYAMLIFVFTILFFFGWLITRRNSLISTTQINPTLVNANTIAIPDNNTVYKFIVNQDIKRGPNLKKPQFSSSRQSIYSALEIEFLDQDYNHVYSVFKDLWVEEHYSKEYSDTKIEFQIEFQNAGQYFVRTKNHNNNNGPITIETYIAHGNLYFAKYLIFFIVLNVILFFGNSYWGTTTMLYNAFKKVKSIKHNSNFLIISSIVIIIFLGCIFISYTHYGYPHSGDEIRLPTYFFTTKDVHYLG